MSTLIPPRRRPGRFTRRVRTIRALAAVALLAFLAQCTSTDAARGAGGLRVLFVGNSLTYTNDLPGLLHRVLVRAGIAVDTVAAIAFPNYGLQDHWEREETLATIRRGRWDVVVMQQGPSATEGRPSLLAYSRRFARLIRSAGARPALYMVWPAYARAFDFDGVADAYRTAAEETTALLFPVGDAWRAAWRRDAGVALYGPDGFHPSLAGSYLAALVMAEQLGPVDLRTLPPEIPTASGPFRLRSDLAVLLQDAAMDANRSSEDTRANN